jgi:hypothetical protein
MDREGDESRVGSAQALLMHRGLRAWGDALRQGEVSLKNIKRNQFCENGH